ncbi:NADH-quinone oxidoreductase subunit E [Octadecabacter ascidiaceicola]|uniref:NADH dehydrogenase subunit E n=1 Tax=Octadecabacter ascidiaceicola TaxID=1655543 RepID=A0A238KKD6_9RHOB|nr:NADH-quinone oxidoreductase subunit E [Octadecabacter ascidiaceicola]SMX43190.1 NADH dehydrogenase subunit E [Octadecabacter ascidiaceicola]
MFKEWGFLLAEIWVLLALAALIGLIAGWFFWGGRSDTGSDADEVRRLQAELDRANARNNRATSFELDDDVPSMPDTVYSRPVSKPVAEPVKTEPVAAPSALVGAKPAGLDAARDGLPDDLTTIKGIGPKMEKLCNRLGFWHFDQIAAWSADEVAWVDDNLEGFKGRVTRDNWVEQAKALSGK